MPNSRTGLSGRHNSGVARRGHVTMIEVGVLHDATRRSKIAFWAVGGVAGLATGVIAAGFTHPLKAALVGIITGGVTGFVAAFIMFCWPALRVAWHWFAELLLLGVFLAVYLELTQLMASWLALTLLVTAACGPMLVPSIRRKTRSLFWCTVSRHRLRLCFDAFIASQRTGMTPLILIARPIPAGERVWVWLRPGLALADLEARLDRLAAGCWAAECRVAPASRRYSALVAIDIVRRNPLDTTLTSPLPGLVPAKGTAATWTSPLPVGGLDLPDVPDSDPASEGKRKPKAVTGSLAGRELTVADILTPAREADDLSEWI